MNTGTDLGSPHPPITEYTNTRPLAPRCPLDGGQHAENNHNKIPQRRENLYVEND